MKKCKLSKKVRVKPHQQSKDTGRDSKTSIARWRKWITVKENVQNKDQAQNIPEIWDSMKRPHLQIGNVEGKETQVKGTVNTFNKLIEENVSNLKNVEPCKV